MDNIVRPEHDATDDYQLPEWCDVYDGLSDEEIERLERAISRRLDLTRSDYASMRSFN